VDFRDRLFQADGEGLSGRFLWRRWLGLLLWMLAHAESTVEALIELAKSLDFLRDEQVRDVFQRQFPTVGD
jgi:hypothetical protein